MAAKGRGGCFRLGRMILEQYSLLLLVIAASAVFSLFNPRFLTLENLVNLSRQIVPLGIIALGASFVIIGGGLDLSAGGGATMCGAALGVTFVLTKNVALSLAVGLGTGLALGTVHAVLITQAGFGSGLGA